MSVLLVTGASRGIGAATALSAAKRGYAVCVNYRQQQQAAQRVVSEIQRAGGRAYSFQADVSSESEVSRLFAAIDKELGQLTALVNNAATLELQSCLESIDGSRLQRVFATNVFGSFYCAR